MSGNRSSGPTNMSEQISCYRCGYSLDSIPLPFGRRDECLNCIAELHVCRMCIMYDVRESDACKEEDALEVTEKDRANFCEYFKPNPKAYTPGFMEAQNKALSELTTLFNNDGGNNKTKMLLNESSNTSEDDILNSAKDLFK